jgi:uncharacterized protein YoxC
MQLYALSVRIKLVAVLFIAAFIMIAVVSSADLTGKRLDKVNNHFKSDELKVQGITTEQWESIAKPKMSTKKEVLYTLVAAAVICGEYKINDPNNDDPSSSGNINNGF